MIKRMIQKMMKRKEIKRMESEIRYYEEMKEKLNEKIDELFARYNLN